MGKYLSDLIRGRDQNRHIIARMVIGGTGMSRFWKGGKHTIMALPGIPALLAHSVTIVMFIFHHLFAIIPCSAARGGALGATNSWIVFLQYNSMVLCIWGSGVARPGV